MPHAGASCSLGELLAGGSVDAENEKLSGYIQVHAGERPSDVQAWRADAEKLLDHVRRVMSFASGTALADPVLHFFLDDTVETHIYARLSPRHSRIPVFHPLASEAILQSAVRSYFEMPFEAKNLWMAMEWIAMEATYNETRIVNVMTALENLVNSNMRGDAVLLENVLFAELKARLSTTIAQFADEHALAPELVQELTLKLNELQRRSLRRKLDHLIARWSIPLDGITNRMIGDAFSARNEIIHEGHYYVEGQDKADLWEHFCVVREIVTRIIFRAIGFEGRYISHLGGYHDAVFPPAKPA